MERQKWRKNKLKPNQNLQVLMVRERRNLKLEGQRKSHVAVKWIICIVVLNVFQLSLFTIDNETIYWLAYDTSSDLISVFFSIALLVSIPYGAVKTKITSAIILIWHVYCLISQIVIDYIIDDPVNGIIATALLTVIAINIFLMRFIFKWSGEKSQIKTGNFYEIIGKPKNYSQLIIAMYSGHGGSFGITDGEYLWHYSKDRNSMVRDEFKSSDVNGKIVKKICVASKEKYNELDLMIGQRFTLMHNCLELHSFATRWNHGK